MTPDARTAEGDGGGAGPVGLGGASATGTEPASGAGRPCAFCQIVNGELAAHVVLDEPDVLAFLDVRPVFPGHTLVIPRVHHETLADLPPPLVEPFFSTAQRVAVAVERGMGADGTFVAINNKVSQSVAHLHTHVVPRRRKDGLRGFFWPRQRYESDEAMADAAAAVRDALALTAPRSRADG